MPSISASQQHPGHTSATFSLEDCSFRGDMSISWSPGNSLGSEAPITAIAMPANKSHTSAYVWFQIMRGDILKILCGSKSHSSNSCTVVTAPALSAAIGAEVHTRK
jgi:hypothetical protein